jgi:hypothetical protein
LTNQLISPLQRARIASVLYTRQEWKGTRQGVRITFLMHRGKHRRIEWLARIKKRQGAGRADTLFEAILNLEAFVAENAAIVFRERRQPIGKA